MQAFSSSLYCSSYEVLLELANCFAVGLVFFKLSAINSFVWKLASWIHTHFALWQRGSQGTLSSQGEKGANIHWMILKWETFGQWLISSPQSKSATFPCQMVCEIYFWASRQRRGIWAALRPHLFTKTLLNKDFRSLCCKFWSGNLLEFSFLHLHRGGFFSCLPNQNSLKAQNPKKIYCRV